MGTLKEKKKAQKQIQKSLSIVADITLSRKQVMSESELSKLDKAKKVFLGLTEKRDRLRTVIADYSAGKIGAERFDTEWRSIKLKGGLPIGKGRKVWNESFINSKRQLTIADRGFIGALTGKSEDRYLIDFQGNMVELVDSETNLIRVVKLLSTRIEQLRIPKYFAYVYYIGDVIIEQKVFTYLLCDGSTFDSIEWLNTLQNESKRIDREKGYRSESPVLTSKIPAHFDSENNFVAQTVTTNLVNQSYDAIVNYGEKTFLRSGKSGGKKLSNTPRPSDLAKAQKSIVKYFQFDVFALTKIDNVRMSDQTAIAQKALNNSRKLIAKNNKVNFVTLEPSKRFNEAIRVYALMLVSLNANGSSQFFKDAHDSLVWIQQ